jgi:hypothetical protein
MASGWLALFFLLFLVTEASATPWRREEPGRRPRSLKSPYTRIHFHFSGLAKYEGSLVHRALHYRKVLKRKGKHTRVLVQKPVGMAAGVLGVRKCNRSAACDVITLEGEKTTKSPAQLFCNLRCKRPYQRAHATATHHEE